MDAIDPLSWNYVGADGIEFVGASAEEADDVGREAEST
jgi:hypothetical protein